MTYAALNTGTDFHLLDHIAPLASLMKIPLIATEEINYELALRYYPQIETLFMPDLEMRLGELADRYDALFECKPWAPHLRALFKTLYKKDMLLIFCPHGQSDKGFRFPIFNSYPSQSAVLLYGDLMIDMLKQLNIWTSISHHAMIGNHRHQFYRKYKAFYDSIAEKEIFSKLDKFKKTLLYAPTWNDADCSTSFFDCGARVIKELPSDWNLIVKVHPLLEQKNPGQYYSVSKWAEKRPHTLLILDFPPVYPILERADAYLGDHSSVGYDFLTYGRPLFFLPTSHPGKLHACGQTIESSADLAHVCKKSTQKQTDLYRFAFAETGTEDEVRQKIGDLIQSLKREGRSKTANR